MLDLELSVPAVSGKSFVIKTWTFQNCYLISFIGFLVHRHGGHKVESGTRYILGAFLLIEDRVEHVRRLKNRGADLRKEGKLDEAIKHFEWALALNPKCTTCKYS